MNANQKDEKPILFSGPMVLAILRKENPKTQTRRVVTPKLWPVVEESFRVNGRVALNMLDFDIVCPYGDVGDQLWVRETWGTNSCYDYLKPSQLTRHSFAPSIGDGAYRADGDSDVVARWRPAIFLPRWASRLTLEITAVRVERLQEISAEDVIAEGIPLAEHKCGCERCAMESGLCPATQSSLILAYGQLWDSINAKRGHGWETNAWVWVLTFNRECHGRVHRKL